MILKQGQALEVLKTFDRNSESQLKEVSIKTKLKQNEVRPLVEILERSEDSLSTLIIIEMNHRRRETLYDLLKKLPQLEDCRIVGPCSQSVRLKLQETSSQSHLKILWLGESKPFYGLRSERLGHLVSLVLADDSSSSPDWPQILNKPSQTLKHLSFTISSRETGAESSTLYFPKLKVLEISTKVTTDLTRFPQWMRIPFNTTLINPTSLCLPLPQISTLWIPGLEKIDNLTVYGPNLRELRITSINNKFEEDHCDAFLKMLQKRKMLVENGFAEQGVRFIQLKTLVLQFEVFKLDHIESLKPFVEEVLDLKMMDNFIEVEV